MRPVFPPNKLPTESDAQYTERMERHVEKYKAAMSSLIPSDTPAMLYANAKRAAKKRLWTRYLDEGEKIAVNNAFVYNPNLNASEMFDEVRSHYHQLALHVQAFIIPLAERHPAAQKLLSNLYVNGLMAAHAGQIAKQEGGQQAGRLFLSRHDSALITAVLEGIERSDTARLADTFGVTPEGIEMATALLDYLKAFPAQASIVFCAMIAAYRDDALVQAYLAYKK